MLMSIEVSKPTGERHPMTGAKCKRPRNGAEMELQPMNIGARRERASDEKQLIGDAVDTEQESSNE